MNLIRSRLIPVQWIVLGVVLSGFFLPGPLSAKDGWKKHLRFTASLTSLGSAHTSDYEDVPGISETGEESSWKVGVDGEFSRKFTNWSQEHRFNFKYGRVNNEENVDELDSISIFRYGLGTASFLYNSAHVRSTFDTFGHPTRFDGAGGVGLFLLRSDTYGELELRVGPRWGREWNPSRSGEGFYEMMVEYGKEFATGSQLTSNLESYTPVDNTAHYTVRWENKLLAPVTEQLDIEYRFTLYYEQQVDEIATKNVSTINFVYYLIPE